MDVRTEKESSFTELFDTYGELLTPRKKEIGEEKGSSRQSVSDCLRTSCEQMKEYDSKLGVIALKKELSALKSAQK